MRLLKVYTVFALSLLMAASGYMPAGKEASGSGSQQSSASDEDRYSPRFGSLTLDEHGPAVSIPHTEMMPNGDRYSPYPPYFHPDDGHNR